MLNKLRSLFVKNEEMSEEDKDYLALMFSKDDGCEEVYNRRHDIHDVEDYLCYLDTRRERTGGCSCHLGGAPCSCCTASIGAFDDVMDDIDAQEKEAAEEREKRWHRRARRAILGLFWR
jgi:hypothetical protein